MRHYERRLTGAFPYFKLAVYDERNFTFRDRRIAYETEAEARAAASRPGRYRVSRIEERKRLDLEPFSV